MSAKAPRKKIRWDLWMIVTVGVSIFYMLFLLYPLISMLSKSVIGEDGGFTWQYFAKVFHKKYYQRAIWGSLKISATVTLITVLLATPLAYIMSTVKIRFAGALQILILVSSMSAPFIGAYAWIMLCGRNGTITNFLLNTFGFKLGDIYGFKGCVIVMSLQLYSLVFMFVSGAFKNLDNSLIEASESLGCSGVRKIFKIVLPLILPTLLSGALMVFMRTFADYGTPMLIGENYNTLPVVVYKEFLSEIGSSDGMAAAISIIAIVITTAVFLLQKYIANRKVFSMSALHPVEAKKLHGVKNVLAHAYCYILVGLAIMPQCYVIYSSFRNTSGKLYTEGFGLGSYKEAFSTVGSSIVHTYALAFAAIFVIVLVSLFVSYVVVRRRNVFNAAIDVVSMFPETVMGSILGIALLTTFNKKPLLLTGGAFIMILSYTIRRMPYTIRSSSAILRNISPSIEEASINLGASDFQDLLQGHRADDDVRRHLRRNPFVDYDYHGAVHLHHPLHEQDQDDDAGNLLPDHPRQRRRGFRHFRHPDVLDDHRAGGVLQGERQERDHHVILAEENVDCQANTTDISRIKLKYLRPKVSKGRSGKPFGGAMGQSPISKNA